jgi:hypothetical protein
VAETGNRLRHCATAHHSFVSSRSRRHCCAAAAAAAAADDDVPSIGRSANEEGGRTADKYYSGNMGPRLTNELLACTYAYERDLDAAAAAAMRRYTLATRGIARRCCCCCCCARHRVLLEKLTGNLAMRSGVRLVLAFIYGCQYVSSTRQVIHEGETEFFRA